MSRTRDRMNLWLAASLALLLAGLPAGEAGASVWPTSHLRIAKAMQSDDAAVRRSAAAQLTSLPPKLAEGLAKEALLDEDVQVRLYAARAVATLGVQGAGDIVVDWLSGQDESLRVAACEVIEASPTPTSVQALGRVLSDAKASVRKAAASAMGSSGLADVVSPLLGHLDDSSAQVRLQVVRSLGRLGDTRAVVPLVSKLQDPDPEVRQAAARALGALGDSRATATLMLTLQDQSLAVRVEALDALGRLRAKEATTAITALLAGDGPTSAGGHIPSALYDAALQALGRIGTPEAVKLLIEALDQESLSDSPAASPVRQALVLAGDSAVTALIAAVNASASRQLASGAALVLGELQAKQALPVIVRATQRGAVSLDAGLRALALLDDPRALPLVLEHIDDPDWRVRQRVVQVATELLDPASGDGRAVDVVRQRVLDPRTALGERLALVQLLGKTGSPRAQQILQSLAKTKTPALRQAAIEGLGRLGLPSAAVDEVLLLALSDTTSQSLRIAAATAIGRVGKDELALQLLHRLGVSAEQDRSAIGIALSGALSRSRQPKLVERARSVIAAVPATSRDALIEGLGRMPTKEAAALLGELAGAADPDDRRKVAEALGGHAGAEPLVLALLGDADPSVRTNAVWSLSVMGSKAALKPLLPLLGDLDVGVAGNAAVAIGRIAGRAHPPAGGAPAGQEIVTALCHALSDYRSYVRANALVGLRFAGAFCEGAKVRHLLSRDRSWRVRLGAADLLRAQLQAAPAGPDQAEHQLAGRALARCAAEDKDAAVAAHCTADRPPPGKPKPVMIYVVPDGQTTPTPRTPFALVLGDGALRLGVADRRGALFEHAAPSGVLRLAVPAALAP